MNPNNLGLHPGFNSIQSLISGRNPKKNDPIKIKIKTQLGELKRKTVSIYIPICNTGSAEALLKFLMILKNTQKEKNINNGTQCYDMTNNLFTGEAL